jgi:biotin-(acetyl-CoA carboxylase) ligase
LSVTYMTAMFDDNEKMKLFTLSDDTPKSTREELMAAALSRLEERVRGNTPQNAAILKRVERRKAIIEEQIQKIKEEMVSNIVQEIDSESDQE